MRSDNPANWTSEPVAIPADVLVDRRGVNDGFARIVVAAAQATGCDRAFIYRRGKKNYLLVAGEGPERIAIDAVDGAFAGDEVRAASDFIQAIDERSTPNACARLGLGGFVGAGFAAATQIGVGGANRGFLLIVRHGDATALNPAQTYVLRAHASHVGTLFELQELRRLAGVRASDDPAKLERLRLLESVAVHARDAILITEAEPVELPGPRILYCNNAFTQTTGYSLEEVIGKTPRILQGPKTDPAAREKLRAAFRAWRPVEVELMNYRKDGSEFWVELSIVPVANEKGWFTHWVSVQRDVTERKQTEELATRVRIAEVENEVLATEILERKRVEAQLLYTAFHDSLTRLRNRAFFMDRLKSVLERTNRDPSKVCAILFMDLDRFKIVNDSLGHLAGDVLLKEIARRLVGCARPQDTLARLGGDEFALLIDDAADPAIPVGVAERILEAMRPPLRIGRQDVFPSCSIGIVQSSARSTHPESLIRDADIAMYVAKRSGFGDYAVFNEAMHAEATAVLNLQTDLQLAIERGEFELVFQPIVDPQHGRIKGFEALIRWVHPTRGVIPPTEFVPVAEEMGLIRQIDRWVMREACAQLAEWRARFEGYDLGISVNTSANEFDDPDFITELKDTLAKHGLPPHALELEITESIFLHPDPSIASIIAEIRGFGVRIGLDDFGTGYSSLSYINRYPTDTIKIDKSFIEDLCTDDRTLAIVVLIIQLAKTLGVDVVAEGVETEEQAELLASMDCSHAQGYFYSRPMAATDATALLARSPFLKPEAQDTDRLIAA